MLSHILHPTLISISTRFGATTYISAYSDLSLYTCTQEHNFWNFSYDVSIGPNRSSPDPSPTSLDLQIGNLHTKPLPLRLHPPPSRPRLRPPRTTHPNHQLRERDGQIYRRLGLHADSPVHRDARRHLRRTRHPTRLLLPRRVRW